LWLRLNPDAYKIDGDTVRTPRLQRYHHMEHVIRTYTPTQQMAVMYLYYSEDCGRPVVMNSPEYANSFKACVWLLE